MFCKQKHWNLRNCTLHGHPHNFWFWLRANSDPLCQFSVIFGHLRLGYAPPEPSVGARCTFCVPRVSFRWVLGVQSWPWSTIWALFGVTFQGFAHTLATHVLPICLYGHAGPRDTVHDNDSNHDTIPNTIWHHSRFKEITTRLTILLT